MPRVFPTVTTPPTDTATKAQSHGDDAGLHVGLELHTEDDDPPLASWLEIHLAKAGAVLGVTRGNLELLVVGDEEMASLHLEHKGVKGTTDVLTFDLSDPENVACQVEGDIVLCLDEAKRQAKQRSHSVKNEMLLYAVHGLLHLLGEDDHTDEAYRQMHRREDEVLTALGFGAVFDRDIEPDDSNSTSNS